MMLTTAARAFWLMALQSAEATVSSFNPPKRPVSSSRAGFKVESGEDDADEAVVVAGLAPMAIGAAANGRTVCALGFLVLTFAVCVVVAIFAVLVAVVPFAGAREALLVAMNWAASSRGLSIGTPCFCGGAITNRSATTPIRYATSFMRKGIGLDYTKIAIQ